MEYDTTIELELNKATSRFEYLVKKRAVIGITQKRQNRTLSQNSYLHLVLSEYAIAYGDTVEYIKQEIWKKQLCKDLFYQKEIVNRVTGEVRDGYRSSRKLNTKEMTIAIDMLRDSASRDLGYYISTPDDMVWVREARNRNEENKQYL